MVLYDGTTSPYSFLYYGRNILEHATIVYAYMILLPRQVYQVQYEDRYSTTYSTTCVSR
jgi:hypothetical protein